MNETSWLALMTRYLDKLPPYKGYSKEFYDRWLGNRDGTTNLGPLSPPPKPPPLKNRR